jgi:hypothetical protein
MKTEALVLMISVFTFVITTTIYLFTKVLKSNEEQDHSEGEK